MTQIINHQSNYQKLPEIVKTLIDNNPLYKENLLCLFSHKIYFKDRSIM
jgi:hypothetical protein